MNDIDDDVTVTTEGDVKTLSFPENGRTIAFNSKTEFFMASNEEYVSFSTRSNNVLLKLNGERKLLNLELTGDDASHFRMVGGHDGVYVVFRQYPDYDDPNDSKSDRTYEFNLVARDALVDAEAPALFTRKYRITITDDPSDNVPGNAGQGGGRSVVPLEETAGSDGLPVFEEELSLPMADIA